MSKSFQQVDHTDSAEQKILKYTYGLVPIIAGLDKFTNLLTNWKSYLSRSIIEVLPFSADVFMKVVGIVEIIAGILVFVRPRTGAYIVMAWLILIAVTLVFNSYYDVAVRDLVMAVGAFVLARLSAPATHAVQTKLSV